MNSVAVYPGSFDPVTNGHLDVIKRAKAIFENVVVAVAHNINKNGLFTAEERIELISNAVGDDPQVEVEAFSGLLVDYVQRRGGVVIRGLRAVADFEYEFQLALMNRRLAPSIDTVFLIIDERSFYISSSLVREVARFGGDVSDFVPAGVKEALAAKFEAG